MANIGYIQVVRHCNHHCGFCSNPKTGEIHTVETLEKIVDDFVARDYYGVILTGGEPTLHPELPRICAYARGKGLHVRLITNGTQMADESYARTMAQAGLQIVHLSLYSVRPEIEEAIRRVPDTLECVWAAMDNSLRSDIAVNVNTVINKLNADHLELNVREIARRHPDVRHFVWNNLDPSMGHAETNREKYTPRLADFELSLREAMLFLHNSGRSFRVEKVPLCYMTEFAWTSTETRKIVKGEERIVHFLDEKGMVRQTEWDHIYAENCDACSLRTICGGLFDRGNGYDRAELYPVFIDRDAIVTRIIQDPTDPSRAFQTLAQWRKVFGD